MSERSDLTPSPTLAAHATQTAATAPAAPLQDWRQAHLGHWLNQALQKFEARVLVLMAGNEDMPLALSNLAARGRLSASHVHITRHLAQEGARLTDLAQRAGMSKQAMSKLVDQCEAWGLVERAPDAHDARAQRIVFSAIGLSWLLAYREAVAQAQAELRTAVGDEVATVLALGLEAYAA
ncbi:MAG: MarR family transcriptional regulator [Gammaproteobacteria bacterium]|uniref:MarR family winged helix-turn-helix transcriptional regulator n=1 Tax=Rhodoferax sp. TaxID=50421 RepID=UPI001816938C|nr:helix-turn-helix domain-containing protein [Rhodoferax sp.]MBU3898291.1 MarR family transcriptional regulator [Gammaproteobacteria bacterium]MBA3059011.1 MarR family transcriptional regulator [Rhodoferax sp.]MBU3998649.1 MarR family transcriptional regulator [Gammaproteobacteria bacterium]MBU4081476.1 MarR family transcriptional regulator [Gammaproteobacteria bacterium]MBU4114255.1 MarR family transcriptional regulator [Gammaproteobacteria bacterium]